ncbi:MAG: glycosyltransferase family protein [Ignavibacteria bacterium]|nr:glycosyltransferase family protein [Ignavibacteria bacterium]
MKRTKNILIVIQARTGSARLPGKVLLQVCGKPLLSLMVERVQYSKFGNNIVIATTKLAEDDKIVSLAMRENVSFFRGHTTDLLDRHFKAAIEFNADVVVKIPSDCPLIDASVLDKVLEYYLENESLYDYVSNLNPPSYPDGNDVEVMSFKTLHTAWKKATSDFDREHTTPYILKNPDLFRTGNVVWEKGTDLSRKLRFTLDYPEDFEFIKTVYEELYDDDPFFGLDDILMLLERKPHIAFINRKYTGKLLFDAFNFKNLSENFALK